MGWCIGVRGQKRQNRRPRSSKRMQLNYNDSLAWSYGWSLLYDCTRTHSRSLNFEIRRPQIATSVCNLLILNLAVATVGPSSARLRENEARHGTVADDCNLCVQSH